jgi:sugar lactone lactonase YvrE
LSLQVLPQNKIKLISCEKKLPQLCDFIWPRESNRKIDLVREQTNGANGLALTHDGDLLAAEGDGKRISKRSRDGTVRPSPKVRRQAVPGAE